MSFAAWGKHAKLITDEHSLSFPLGDNSPLARVYELDGQVLLLGVGHGNNTSLHLAEARAEHGRVVSMGGAILREHQRHWVTYEDWQLDNTPFEQIGADFNASGMLVCVTTADDSAGLTRTGRIGAATAMLFSQRACVDFATKRITEFRAEQMNAV